MTTAITEKVENSFVSSISEAHDHLSRDHSPWLNRIRENAMDRFERSGLPTTDDEEWKYTNVAAIAKAGFRPKFSSNGASSPISDLDLPHFCVPETSHSQLVFVNGAFNPARSRTDGLPQWVIATSLGTALRDSRQQKILREHLAREADQTRSAFADLNSAFINDGAFLLIPKGVRVERPIQLMFISSSTSGTIASFPRILIVAEAESQVSVIESYAGIRDDSYFTNAVVEIVLGDGANVTHCKLQRESLQSFHVAATHVRLGRAARFDSTSVTLGARLSRHDIRIAMPNEGAECWVDGLYVVGDGQHTDTHSLIDHLSPQCTSHQLYKGILDGKSRAVFNGKVFVHKGANGTDAMQKNKNLLLSNDARVDTKPQLEIFADDVKCAHGATVGQLEEEELFYLLSRGMRPELARNLLTYGFAEEVINKIRIESIKEQLDEAVLNRLHARIET